MNYFNQLSYSYKWLLTLPNLPNKFITYKTCYFITQFPDKIIFHDVVKKKDKIYELINEQGGVKMFNYKNKTYYCSYNRINYENKCYIISNGDCCKYSDGILQKIYSYDTDKSIIINKHDTKTIIKCMNCDEIISISYLNKYNRYLINNDDVVKFINIVEDDCKYNTYNEYDLQLHSHN